MEELELISIMLFAIVCGQILQAFMLAGIRDCLADLAWYAGFRTYTQAGRAEVDDTTDF